MPKWCDESGGDVRRIRAMARDGYRMKDVAADYGTTVPAVDRFARKHGIVFRRGGPSDPDLRLTIINLILRGYTTGAAVGRAMTPRRTREAVNLIVSELERSGALRRVGYGRWTRIELVGSWK